MREGSAQHASTNKPDTQTKPESERNVQPKHVTTTKPRERGGEGGKKKIAALPSRFL